jgi:hypothetical protein
MNPRISLTRLIAPALLAASGFAAPAARAGDVGVSIAFSQPGVYGRVDVGRYPAPVLVAPQPVVIGQPVYADPVYLWVPPAHRRDWRHNCYRYGACGAPVYFVQDGWYQQNVVVRYERDRRWRDDDDDHGHRHHGRGRGHGHGDHDD